MPVFVHGRNTRVLFVNNAALVGYDLSPYFNEASPSIETEAVESTTFQTGNSKSYIVGEKDGSFTLGGNYDGTVNGVDATLTTEFATDVDAALMVFPNGALTDGDRCFVAQGNQTKYELKSPVSGIVGINGSFQADRGVWRGFGGFLNISGAGSSGSVTNSFPLGINTPYPASSGYPSELASTSNGGVLVLAVLSLTGTTPGITLNFQHAAGSTYTDLGPTLSAVGGMSTTLAGTVQANTRVYWTLTGTNPAATIFYGFARY